MPLVARAAVFYVVASALLWIGGIPAILLLLMTIVALTVERRDADTLGLRPKPRRLLQLAVGAAGGGAMLVVWLWFAGTAFRFVPRDVERALLLHFASAAAEELAFRGYGFARVREAFGTLAAQIAAAVLFAAYHVMLGMPLLAAVVFTATGSLLYGYAFVRSEGVALPIGMHFGWNFVQQALVAPHGTMISFARSYASLLVVTAIAAAAIHRATRRSAASTIRLP